MNNIEQLRKQKILQPSAPKRAPLHLPPMNAHTIQRAQQADATLRPAELLSLQRSLGNRAVGNMLGRNSAGGQSSQQGQSKLTVGSATDRYEQEADAIAGQVTHKGRSAQAVSQSSQMAQRQSEHAPVAGSSGGELDHALAQRVQRAQGGGQPLPTSVRDRLEPNLGADLSQVKVHTGPEAVQLNREMGALAFTHQNHIYYGAGQSPNDLDVTAHETVHTIQQGAVANTGGSPISQSAAPSVQRIFGRNMKKRIKANAYPNIEPIVAKAERGTATVAELQKALAKVAKYRAAAAKMKGVDTAERINTLNAFEDVLSTALAELQRDASRAQAKQIYLNEAVGGKFKALETSTSYFKQGEDSVEPPKGLHKGEAAALTTYSGNDYGYINPAVANNKKWMGKQKEARTLKGSEKERFQEGSLHAAMMLEGMAKMEPWTGTGYRGERMSAERFAERYEESDGIVTAKQGSWLTDAFWSVSLDRSTGQGFANDGVPPDETISVLYVIDVGNAHDMQEFSTSAHEEEVVCPVGSKVAVTRVEKKGDGPKGSPTATAWYVVHLKQDWKPPKR